ncbi:MAG: right-handed parallel beta-helix repeat-containing protein [Candidatus Bathyarchaeia archaeon]|nr:right-handed parallel beta-helix repeat-containing protein [Candidatus Bathyarchaeota archaeon]
MNRRKLIAILLIIAISISSATISIFYFVLGSEKATRILDVAVYPTINSAGIIVTYQGDENFNNKASVRFRSTVDRVWREGHPLSPLRELKQLAGSLVYLNPGTEYEIIITIEDPDGVDRSELHTVFKTRSEPSDVYGAIGRVFYVSPDGDDRNPGSFEQPWRTISRAVSELQPGDTLYLRGGVYYVNGTVDVAISGLPDRYITIKGYPDEIATLYGSDRSILDGRVEWIEYREGVYFLDVRREPTYIAQGVERLYHYTSLEDLLAARVGYRGGWFYDSSTGRLYIATLDGAHPSRVELHVSFVDYLIRISGNYVRIADIEVAYASCGVAVRRGYRGCIIEGCHIHNVNTGILLSQRVADCIIQNNVIWDTGIIKWPWDMVKGTEAEGSGVSLSHAGSGNVVRFNRIEGLFNGIAASSWGDLYNTTIIRDTDIHDNYIANVGDDGLEPEGSGINFRMWNNFIVNSLCAISLAPITYGPIYVFRNICIDFRLMGVKLNSGYASSGWKYLYHNTFYSSITQPSPEWRQPPIGIGDTSAKFSRLITRNNILHLSSDNYILADTVYDESSYDYDNMYISGLHSKFVIIQGKEYTTLYTLRTLLNLEKNGISADSLFISPDIMDFRLSSNSPCIDAGVYIPNFNDNYYGKAPDIGALEHETES